MVCALRFRIQNRGRSRRGNNTTNCSDCSRNNRLCIHHRSSLNRNTDHVGCFRLLIPLLLAIPIVADAGWYHSYRLGNTRGMFLGHSHFGRTAGFAGSLDRCCIPLVLFLSSGLLTTSFLGPGAAFKIGGLLL